MLTKTPSPPPRRLSFTLTVATALLAVLVPVPLLTSAASAQTTQDIEVRDSLIANQEALLNVYRCRFNIDTQVVPGGCTNGEPTLPPVDPVPFGATPTEQDITARDTLVQAQESLLNVYRCQFNIDTQIVPGGCPDQQQPEPAPTPEQTNGQPEEPIQPSDQGTSDLVLFSETSAVDPELTRQFILEVGPARWVAMAEDYSTPAATLDVLPLSFSCSGSRYHCSESNQKYRIALAGHSDAPSTLLVALANYGLNAFPNSWSTSLLTVVAGHPNTPTETLARLAGDAFVRSSIGDTIATNPNTPLEVLKEYRLSTHAYYERHEVILAANTDTSLDILAQLAESRYASVRQAVAANPNSPAHLLIQLADVKPDDQPEPKPTEEDPNPRRRFSDPAGKVRSAVATNPNTPAEVLAQLANAPESVVRIAVAASPVAPADLLALLAYDPESDVRIAVALNASTPANVRSELLTQLASDRNVSVRSALASNPKATADLLTQLANDPATAVRTAVASNSNAPADLLTQLASDPDAEVRDAVAFNLSAPTHIQVQLLAELIANSSHRSQRLPIAENSYTPPDVLAQLAKDSDSWVRDLVLRNPATPSNIVLDLGFTHDTAFLLAKFPHLTSDAVNEVARRYFISVQEAQEARDRCTKQNEEQLDDVASSDCGPTDTSSRPDSIALLITFHPLTSDATLQALADSADPGSRMAVALSPNSPEALLNILTRDKHPDVRRTATENLNSR